MWICVSVFLIHAFACSNKRMCWHCSFCFCPCMLFLCVCVPQPRVSSSRCSLCCDRCRLLLFGCQCLLLPQEWRHSVIQRARGGRPSRCAESENYYAGFKDRLRCRSIGMPFFLLRDWVLTHIYLRCNSRQSSWTAFVLQSFREPCLQPPRYHLVRAADWGEGEVVTTQTIAKHGKAGNSRA